MSKTLVPIVNLLLSVALLGCLGSAEYMKVPDDQAAQKALSADTYVIGPEDVLEVAVWQNQDLSRTATVRPDGMIGLPLIGDVQAAGLTPAQVQISIGQKLVPYMGTPQVAVIVQQINSWRIYVQGEVRTPGVYPIRSYVALSQAITMAGGFTEFAKKSRIQVIRKRKNATEFFKINYNDIIKGNEDRNNLMLIPGDTVIVP